METITFIGSVLGVSGLSAAVLFACGWYLKEHISAWLIGNQSKELEKYKAELNMTAELLRFDLQKNIARTELHSNSIFKIYPELFQKLRIAHGVVSGIYGFRYTRDWTGYAKVDFEVLLAEKNIPTGIRDNLISNIENERESGIKNFEDFLWNQEFNEAIAKLFEFKNFILLNEIYLLESVRELSFNIHKLLISAKVNADMSRRNMHSSNWMINMQKDLDEAATKIDQLRLIIAIELSPSTHKS